MPQFKQQAAKKVFWTIQYLIKSTKEYKAKYYGDINDYENNEKGTFAKCCFSEIMVWTSYISWQQKEHYSLKRLLCIHLCKWKAHTKNE